MSCYRDNLFDEDGRHGGGKHEFHTHRNLDSLKHALKKLLIKKQKVKYRKKVVSVGGR